MVFDSVCDKSLYDDYSRRTVQDRGKDGILVCLNNSGSSDIRVCKSMNTTSRESVVFSDLSQSLHNRFSKEHL